MAIFGPATTKEGTGFLENTRNAFDFVTLLRSQPHLRRMNELQEKTAEQNIESSKISDFLNMNKLMLASQEAERQNALAALLKGIPQGTSTEGKLIADREAYARAFGEDSPQVSMLDQLIEQKLKDKEGLQLSIGPDGGLQFSTGGTVSRGTLGGSENVLAGIIKDPRFGKSRSGEGGVFVDPQSGTLTISPSSQSVAKLDNVMSGGLAAIPLVDELIKLNDFGFGAKKIPFEIKKKISEYTGVFADNPDLIREPEYNQAITKIGETLMSALSLPNSEKSLEAMFNMVKRESYENPRNYAKRMGKLKKNIGERIRLARELREKGFTEIQLQEAGILSPEEDEEAAKYVRRLGSDSMKFKVPLKPEITANAVADTANKRGLTEDEVMAILGGG